MATYSALTTVLQLRIACQVSKDILLDGKIQAELNLCAVRSTDTESYKVVRNDDEKPVVTCDVMATTINSFIADKLTEGAYPLEISYSDMEKAVRLLDYSHGVMRILEGGAPLDF